MGIYWETLENLTGWECGECGEVGIGEMWKYWLFNTNWRRFYTLFKNTKLYTNININKDIKHNYTNHKYNRIKGLGRSPRPPYLQYARGKGFAFVRALQNFNTLFRNYTQLLTLIFIDKIRLFAHFYKH